MNTPIGAARLGPAAQASAPTSAAVTGLGEAVGVFRLAGRVLVQHGPVLFALALVGEILRTGAIYATAQVGYAHESISFLIFAIAPLAYLVMMILMLYRARLSLPDLGRTAARKGAVITNIAAVLVPFLVYYATAGKLAKDQQQWVAYVGFIALDKFKDQINSGESLIDRLRYPEPTIPLLWVPAVVLVIGALRWVLKRSAFAERHPITGVPAAYLEVLWLVVVTTLLTTFLTRVALPWAQHRRAWVATVDWIHSDFHSAGLFAGPIRSTLHGWTSVWSHTSAALLVPVAALLTAAIVYGVQSPPTARLPRRRTGGTAGAVARALITIPTRAVTSRVGPAVSGFRVMVRAGLVPMSVFCIAYAAVTVTPAWLVMGERAAIGPQNVDEFWFNATRLADRLNSAVGTTLLVCLVAGAVGQAAHRLTSSDAPLASSGQQPDVVR